MHAMKTAAEEEWRPIPGWEYEGYDISSCSRIRNRHGRILRQAISDRGYRFIVLCRNSRPRAFRVHRLLMHAFIGPCPDGMEVNHKNGIKTDNRLENLEYVTRSQQALHAYALGLSQPKNAKLSLEKADEIRRRRREGESARALAREFGVSHSRIYQIALNHAWRTSNTATR